MRQKLYYFLLTTLLGLMGMNAWAQTTYEISDADGLLEFAEAVNGGETSANAVLTDNINLLGEEWTPIGNAEAKYTGTFDGGGYTISNFNLSTTSDRAGLFGYLTDGAVVKNFTIEGSIISNNNQYVGVVGSADGGTVTISDVHSKLNITCSKSRHGGILGAQTGTGTINIDRCTYSGKLTVTGNVTGNFGGIVGLTNNNAAAFVNISNCLFDGEIDDGTGDNVGGIVGYTNGTKVTIKNCLSYGTLTAAKPGQFFGQLNGSNSSWAEKNYYVEGNVVGNLKSGVTLKGTAPVAVTAEQLASGEICYALNGDQSDDVNWFQTLDKITWEELTYTGVEYVGTVNGDDNNPKTQTTDITLVNNGDGTINIVLTNFSVVINGVEANVPSISLDNIPTSRGEDGLTHFDVENGTFTIPFEDLPTLYQTLVNAGYVSFENIPFTLHGKMTEEKIYSTIDISITASAVVGGNKEVAIVVGTDDFGSVVDYPKPYGTDVVYPAGRQHCDGTAYEGVTGYTNTPAAKDDHDFDDGFCSYCDTFDPEYMDANADGIYEIGTPNQLRWFAVTINAEHTPGSANAILTADIDLTGKKWAPIGNDKAKYTGIFDGQGHAITNFSYTATSNNNGLFGYIDGESVIKDFRISGTLTSDGYNYNGLVGQAEGNSKVTGIYSDMNINVSNFKAHTGGIVGGCTTGSKILVEKCEYAGTLTHSGAGDCQAGILGYTYGGGVMNCLFSGTIIGENSKYGGILGYCKVPSFQGIQNCLSIGKIVASEECTTAAAIIANWNGDVTEYVKNNYYRLADGSTTTIAIGNKAANCEAPVDVTDEQLASGEIAYKLGAAWGQEIGVDAHPVIDGKRVFEFGDTYANIEAESSNGSDDCILPSMKWGGSYQAYTYVAQGNFDYGDWNTSNPNYNVIIGTPAEQDGKAWYTPGYNVTSWNYGQDLPNFGDGRPADVYAVRFFTVDGEIPSTLYMPAAHDDAPCEYYINGEQIWAETDGWFEEEVVRLTDEQKALIKTDGTVNVFAFHVHQNWGGRYADGGLYTAGAPVDAFNNDGNKKAIDATIAIMEAQGIGAEEIEYASNINYRNGFAKGLAQLRKARRLAFDARTEDFTGSAPADGMIAYILNVGAKMFLAGGNDWGTHASLNHMGAKCVLHANTSGANRYTIQTNLPNGTRGRNDGLGHNGYVDCGDWNTTDTGWAWGIEAAGDGTYYIINCENSGDNIYLGMTDDERLQVDTDKAGADNEFNKWIFVTPEEFMALAENATPEAPVDLGHLVHQATFSQNDFEGDNKWAADNELQDGNNARAWELFSKWDRNAGWIWGWKGNDAGGDYVFEMWNTADKGYVYLVQEVEGLPAGKYTVQMNGYYRDGNFESADEGNVRQLAYLYAGSEENCIPLASIVEGSGNCPGYGRGGASGIVIPDNCFTAAKFFQVGTYVNTIEAEVGADGKLVIGVFRDAEDVKGGDWIIADNWRLYYQGRSIDATITEAGYATFVAPWNINTIPEGVEAFAAQQIAGKDYVHLEPVTAIPAGEAVVLKGAEGTYTFFGTSEAAELGVDNDLIAATAEVEADGTQYILAVVNEEVGFAKATPATTIAAGKGYLVITGGDVKPFYPFGTDGATGIANTLKADENTVIYNVAGQRLSKMQKGINIIGNKKVLH